MASDRKLIVSVIGDDSSFQATLKRSASAAAKFGSDVTRSLGRGITTRGSFEPLLEDVRRMRTEADALKQSLSEADRPARDLALTGAKIGAGFFVGGRALSGAGAAIEAIGGESTSTSRRLGDLGDAFTSLVTLNPAGVFEAIGAASKRTREALVQYTNTVDDVNNSQKALEVAAGAALLGFEKEADALREHVSVLEAAKTATDALAFSQRDFNVSVLEGIPGLVRFRGAVDDAAGPRGPGARAFEEPAAPRPGLPTLPSLSPSQRRELELVTAQEVARIPLLKDRLRELNGQLADFNGNQEQRLRLATRAKQTEAEIASIYEQQAAAQKALAAANAAAAAAAARDAEAARKEAEARRRALAEAQKSAEQARQFRALGLTGAGDRPPPTIANLLKQVTQLGGRDDLTGNQRGVLQRIRKVLIDPLRKATPETRAAAKDLIGSIRETFDEELGGTGPLTRTSSLRANKILQGLGLDTDEIKQLRARLSSFNSAGIAQAGSRRPSGQFGGDIVVNVTTTLDGRPIAKNTTRHQQKNAKRNPVQKRGSRRGGV